MQDCIRRFFFLIITLAALPAFAQQSTLRPLNELLQEGALKTALSTPPVTIDYAKPERALTPTEISEINRPATVKVIAKYAITLLYNKPGNFQMVFLKMEANNAALYGYIPNTDYNKLNYILAQLSKQPGKYIVPASIIERQEFAPGATGSGAFITPDGYVLTNAHVIAMDAEAIKTQAVLMVLDQIINSQLSGLIAEYGGRADQDLLDAAIAGIVMYYIPFIQIADEKLSYQIQTGKTLEQPDYILDAALIVSGESIPGKDVAILKVSGNHFPVVAFGDDRVLKSGDPLYVMGYPGLIESHDILKAEVMREPTFTSGIMTARQKTVQGWTAIQLDAATYRGNSGGPVFNAHGEVVGILTFGTLDEGKTSLIQGYNFIVPSHVIGEFVRSANITSMQGPAMAAYRTAVINQHSKPRDAIKQLEVVEKYNGIDWPYFSQTKMSVFALAQNMPIPWYEIAWSTLTSEWYLLTPAIIIAIFLLLALLKRLF